ncbi:MAG: dethiobiotin synthase [Sideroxydans sp.]|nr:dethiobiotin synthase [Sideroxydans sp.]
MSYFVTGTDTNVGKTLISCALLECFAAQGATVIGMKPVAAGGSLHSNGDTPDVPLAGAAGGSLHSNGDTPDVPLAGIAGIDASGRNEDVILLNAASTVCAENSLINPYHFASAIAPHLAAQQENIRIDLPHIVASFHALQTLADVVIVEGAGGFIVPLNDTQDSGDLAVQLGLPIILVVGMRLGCLNHALLTVQAIAARGLTLAGWVANCLDENMTMRAENIAALQQRIASPLLGIVPFQPQPDACHAATCLSVASCAARI